MEATKVLHKEKILAPKLRFTEFDETWLAIELNSCVSLVSGFPFQSELFFESGSKLMTPKNFTKTGQANFDKKNTKFSTEKVDSKYICKSGDLLVLLTDLTPTCELLGKPVLLNETDGEVLLNQRIVKVIEDEKKINKAFLSNLFQTNSYHKRIKETSSGTTVRHSSNRILLSYKTKIPSLPEQQKIASFLSAVDEKIQQLTRKKELLEQYKKGVMQQLFSGKLRFKDENGKAFPEWEEKRLGDVGKIRMCKRIFSHQTSENGDIPFFKIGTFGNVADAYIPRNLFIEFKEKYPYPKEGEILMSASGTLGRTVIYDGNEAYFQDSNIVWIENNEELITNAFLFYVYQVVKYDSEGGTIQRLYNSIISNAFFLRPSLSEQHKVTNLLSSIDTKIESVNKQIVQTQTFKKGLLQQMFV